MRALILAALLAALPMAGLAQPLVCIPAQIFESLAEERYGEGLAFTGASSAGGAFRLYIDPDDGSWTLALQPGGGADVLCAIASGERGTLRLDYLPES